MITKKGPTRLRYSFYAIDQTVLHNSSQEIEPSVPFEVPRIGETVSLTDDDKRGVRGTVSQVLRQTTFGSGGVGESISIICLNSSEP